MKINDAVWGACLLLLSVAILVHIQSFPRIPGQQIGPALFPGVIGVALGVCALILVLAGVATHRRDPAAAPWLTVEDWMRSPRHVASFFLVIAVNIFYIVLVDRLGFIPTAVIYLGVLFAAFGVRARSNLPLALALVLAIHYSFYKLLKVPLPWGLLERFAW